MELIRRTFPRLTRRTVTAAALLALPMWLGACGKGGSNENNKLSDPNQVVMKEYEDIRSALAADDLRVAKQAAGKMIETLKPATPNAPASPMLEAATNITNAAALDRARQAFKTMSVEAIRLTNGVKGYYVINCPMTPNGDWVQTNESVDNPYMGKIMHDCGVLRK